MNDGIYHRVAPGDGLRHRADCASARMAIPAIGPDRRLSGEEKTRIGPMRLYDLGFTFMLVAAACAAVALVVAAQVA